MRITFITPGTGSYYCGVCMRDNALVRELRRRGHDAIMMPMYLPSYTDEPAESAALPVFFGGINAYLQQKIPFFRHSPAWLDRILDSRILLRWAARRSGMTEGADLGALTVSTLRGEAGFQAKEVRKMVGWMAAEARPDLVYLSTAMQAGLAASIKRELGGPPVYCFLQGEDSFLDSLPEPHREESWAALRAAAGEVDGFIAPSAYFAGLMRDRLALGESRVRVLPNGIDLAGFAPAESAPEPPVLGYLSRMVPGKGMAVVVDAFIRLRRDLGETRCRLHLAGAMTPADETFVRGLRKKLEAAGLGGEVRFLPNLEREEKLAFLRGLTLLSVPANYGEAFGLYLLEALASGVPVVQPRTAAYPEIIEATGGGVLYEGEKDPAALAAAWRDLLARPDDARAMGARGMAVVRERYSVQSMAEGLLAAAGVR